VITPGVLQESRKYGFLRLTVIMFHLIRQMAPPVGDMRTHHEKHSFHIYLLDDSAIALKPSEDIVLVLH